MNNIRRFLIMPFLFLASFFITNSLIYANEQTQQNKEDQKTVEDINNLLKNPSFEIKGKGTNLLDFWNVSKMAIDNKFISLDSTAYSGKLSLKFNSSVYTGISCNSNYIPVNENDVFLINCWVKTSNVRGQQKTNYPFISVNWYDNTKKYLRADSKKIPIDKKDWFQVEFDAAPPVGTSFATISLNMSNCTGSIWFDDISFKKIE